MTGHRPRPKHYAARSQGLCRLRKEAESTLKDHPALMKAIKNGDFDSVEGLIDEDSSLSAYKIGLARRWTTLERWDRHIRDISPSS